MPFNPISSIISAIALLSLLGANLDLGYLAENLVANYQKVRDIVWFPIINFIDVPDRLLDTLTFWCVFIPAFLLRGHTENNIAAISFVGSTALMIIASIVFLIGVGFEKLTGFFSWVGWVQDSNEAGFLSKLFVVILFFVSLPYLALLCVIVYGWLYWWLVFLFPHLGIAIQMFFKKRSSGLLELVKLYFILFPYGVGCACVRMVGLGGRVMVEPEDLYEASPKWMSIKETKQYYLPVRDVLIVFFALILLSKIISDSSS